MTLTLTCNVTITLHGSGAIPLEPIVFTTDTTTTAKTAAAAWLPHKRQGSRRQIRGT